MPDFRYGFLMATRSLALKLGARYRRGGWYAPSGADLSAFGERGWL
jgi:DNA topoisomerase III